MNIKYIGIIGVLLLLVIAMPLATAKQRVLIEGEEEPVHCFLDTEETCELTIPITQEKNFAYNNEVYHLNYVQYLDNEPIGVVYYTENFSSWTVFSGAFEVGDLIDGVDVTEIEADANHMHITLEKE